MFELRTHRPQDRRRLLEIDQLCFVSGISYTEEELEFFLARSSAITLVAEEKGSVAGFIIADRVRSRRAATLIGHIITIDVLPEARRSGLGSRLLSAAEQALKKAGCENVSLEVAVDNAPALSFYKRHGYAVLKVLPRYYLDSIDGLLMGKKL